MVSARPYSASGLSKAHERSESIGDVLDLLSERRELRSVGAGEVLQVRNESDNLVDHILHRLRLPARHAEGPFDLLLCLRRKFVPAIVLLPEQVVLGHLFE